MALLPVSETERIFHQIQKKIWSTERPTLFAEKLQHYLNDIVNNNPIAGYLKWQVTNAIR